MTSSTSSHSMHKAALFFGIFFALGVTAGGYFIGQTMYNARVALNTAQAKGLAERRVTADRALWHLSFTVNAGKDANIPQLYQKAEQHQHLITQFLIDNGFNGDEITPDIIEYDLFEYRDKNRTIVDEKHTLKGSLVIESHDVNRVREVRTRINRLITQGVDITNHAPKYFFTKLNEIKPAMVKEATQNARIAAGEFAADAGVKVGRIRSAHQGGFSIRDAGEDYGDTSKIEKEVRIVTTITFYLTD